MTTIVFDTATTGMPKWGEPDEAQPHMIRLAWAVDDAEPVCHLIKPMPGWTMEADAIIKHGISMDTAQQFGHNLREVIEQFSADLARCDTAVAFAWDFHRRVVERAAREVDATITWTYSVDAMKSCMKLVGKVGSSGRVTFPKMSEAYWHFTGQDMPSPDLSPIVRGAKLVECVRAINRGTLVALGRRVA